jgi:flagellar protein FliS
MATVINTMNKGNLILMLYDGALKYLQKAYDAFTLENDSEANTNIIKAQNILTELMVSLDMSKGDVAKNLYNLYDYMNHSLIEVNIKKDKALLKEVENMLWELRQTWELAIKKLEEEKV